MKQKPQEAAEEDEKKNKKKIIRARVNSGGKEEYMAMDEYKAARNTGERKRERM